MCGDVSRLKTCWNYVGKEASKAGVILPTQFIESGPWSELSQSFAQGRCKFDDSDVSPVSMVRFSTALMGLCHFQLKAGSSPSWEMPGQSEFGFREKCSLFAHLSQQCSFKHQEICIAESCFVLDSVLDK